MKKDNKVMDANSFVKREQEVLRTMMGGQPVIPAEMKRFNAFMSNDGEKAKENAREITKGIDKKAFPVR